MSADARNFVLVPVFVLSEAELNWLQSGVVQPFTPTQKKGRSPVSWRQAKRREHRLQQKFFLLHCPPLFARHSTGPFRFSGVSGLLRPRHSKWSSDYASASPAPMHISPGTNFLVEKRFMKCIARRTKARGVWMSCASPEAAASAELGACSVSVLPVVACEEFKRGVCTGMCFIIIVPSATSYASVPSNCVLSCRCSDATCIGRRHQADYFRRSAALIPSSVGALSSTHRLHVDDEFRLLLSGSGPCFTVKEARTGTLPVRRVGNVYYDREFADIVLRYMLQSGSRLTTSLNRFQCDIQLRGCVLGHMLSEHECGL